MAAPTPDDVTSHIHPGVWGALGAAIISLGRVGVAAVKNYGKKGPTISEQLEAMRETLNSIRAEMATREDVGELHGRLNEHINAHAEGKFK